MNSPNQRELPLLQPPSQDASFFKNQLWADNRVYSRYVCTQGFPPDNVLTNIISQQAMDVPQESFFLLSYRPKQWPLSATRPLSPPQVNTPYTISNCYPDRLYLASYTAPPNEETVFPYAQDKESRSPSKRAVRNGVGASPVKKEVKVKHPPYYFSVDDTLLYNAFHHDFGPLHIGHLYRFAVQFHDILSDPENKGRPVVFWSKADARSA